MKRIFKTVCALALVMAGSTTAMAAEDVSDTSYSPVHVETYNYGDFDKLGMNKIYQLSTSDDPRLIPTEDFEHNGRRYFLLELIREDEAAASSEDGYGTVTYTAVFGSEKLPARRSASCSASADLSGLKRPAIIGAVVLGVVHVATFWRKETPQQIPMMELHQNEQ